MLTNRLRDESSPYLRQHAGNPVHWQPWDESALVSALKSNRLIFLSIGYSSCHWCHVMEHESFEDPLVAEILNENFVCIKVDREERPDLDDAYMSVVQTVSGRGGWPMSVFLTPDLSPIYGGTYWPKEDRGGHAGFTSLLKFFSKVWKEQQSEVELQARDLALFVKKRREQSVEFSSNPLESALIDQCISAVLSEFDSTNGGIGDKPKFPPHTALLLLQDIDNPLAREFCETTLEKIYHGGIHDWVGGGFHRYSTDEKWLLPHFEKMLYDNALLLIAYGRAGNKEAVDDICTWLEREMKSPDGLYYSALDADSEGEEGLFYTWTFDEAAQLVSTDFLETFQFKKEGNFRDEATGEISGRNILHLRQNPTIDLRPGLQKLFEVREKRIRPYLDKKCLISWNGLLISGFVSAARIEAAMQLAEAITKLDPIPHQVTNGIPMGSGFADIGFLVQGLLDLADETGDQKWKEKATSIFLDLAKRFRDPKGGWYLSESDDAESLGRTKPWQDSPMPSVNGVLALCSSRLGYSFWASQDLLAMQGWMERFPHATEALHIALNHFIKNHSVQTKLSEYGLQTDGRYKFEIQISIPKGHHLTGIGESSEFGKPVELKADGFQISEVTTDASGPNWTKVVTVTLIGTFIDDHAVVNLGYQSCTDTECLAPAMTSFVLNRPAQR